MMKLEHLDSSVRSLTEAVRRLSGFRAGDTTKSTMLQGTYGLTEDEDSQVWEVVKRALERQVHEASKVVGSFGIEEDVLFDILKDAGVVADPVKDPA